MVPCPCHARPFAADNAAALAAVTAAAAAAELPSVKLGGVNAHLGLSATSPDLGPVGGGGSSALDDAAFRPSTAPLAPIDGGGAAAPATAAGGHALPLASATRPKPPFELTEQIEMHVLENQRLREQLLHFTSKQPVKGGKKRSGVHSLGMPLPPV